MTLGLAAFFVPACSHAPEPSETTGTDFAALGAYDQCARVLEGDLFNRINSNQDSSQAARAIFWQTLLSMSEDQAYNKYSQLHDEYHKAGGGGGFSLLGFSINGNGGAENKLTREEFGEAYRLAKAMNSSSTSYDWSSSSSFTSGYASYIRDPETIRAWRDCVTTQPQPGIYAFGSRDDAGNAFVQVVWTPGQFAGIAPAIEVNFVPQPGYQVVAEQKPRVAVGTGAIFAVESADVSKAIKVSVNGEVYDDAGHLRGSFSSVANIPPAQMPPTVLPDRDTMRCGVARSDALRRGELTPQQFAVYQSINYAPEYAIEHARDSEIIGWGECAALVGQL